MDHHHLFILFVVNAGAEIAFACANKNNDVSCTSGRNRAKSISSSVAVERSYVTYDGGEPSMRWFLV